MRCACKHAGCVGYACMVRLEVGSPLQWWLGHDHPAGAGKGQKHATRKRRPVIHSHSTLHCTKLRSGAVDPPAIARMHAGTFVSVACGIVGLASMVSAYCHPVPATQ